jgi:rhamnosyltransferase
MSKGLAASLTTSVCENWQQLQSVSLHDWYCYAYARAHGYRWYIDPQPSMSYRQHESNQVGANKGLSSLLARYKAIRSGWWFNQVRLIAQLVGCSDEPFVRGWLGLQRKQLIRLSFSARKCRRCFRDRVFFFLVCWVVAFRENTA